MLPSFPHHVLLDIPLISQQDFAKDSHTQNKRLRDEKTEKNEFLMKRRIIHRDIERQRRQEMTTLYTSLRSLLPLEYIRGKRSISDHMQEAMNYIKNSEKRIQELRGKRDKLNSRSSVSKNLNTTSFQVSLNSCRGGSGVEVLITCDHENGIPLSRILIELINSNLTVTCCVSTRSYDRFLYTIQSQVNDLGCVHFGVLHQKLVNGITYG